MNRNHDEVYDAWFLRQVVITIERYGKCDLFDFVIAFNLTRRALEFKAKLFSTPTEQMLLAMCLAAHVIEDCGEFH